MNQLRRKRIVCSKIRIPWNCDGPGLSNEHHLPLPGVQSSIQCNTLIRKCQLTVTKQATGHIEWHLGTGWNVSMKTWSNTEAPFDCEYAKATLFGSNQQGNKVSFSRLHWLQWPVGIWHFPEIAAGWVHGQLVTQTYLWSQLLPHLCAFKRSKYSFPGFIQHYTLCFWLTQTNWQHVRTFECCFPLVS